MDASGLEPSTRNVHLSPNGGARVRSVDTSLITTRYNSFVEKPASVVENGCDDGRVAGYSGGLDGQDRPKVESELRENGFSGKIIFINFLKGMIGPGVLSVPMIFQQAGLLTALVLIPVFAFLNNFCMLQLVNCSQYLSQLRASSPTQRPPLDYGSVGYEAFAQSFPPLRRYSRPMRAVINTAIVALQIGICAVSFVFNSAHLKVIIGEVLKVELTQKQLMLLLLPPLVLLNFTRTLRSIAWLSLIGSVLMISAVVFVLQALFFWPHYSPRELPWITDFSGVVSACGTTLYAFEGQAMVLPLENKLRDPSKMVGPVGVLSVAMATVSVIYLAMGVSGYLTYGEHVLGSITLNLPHRAVFVVLDLSLVTMATLGFVLQQYVIFDMLWPKVEKRLVERKVAPRLFVPTELAFRAALVVTSMLIAITVPNLEKIIPLVGTTCGNLLAFIFPALMDTATFLPRLVALRREATKESERKKRTAQIYWRVVQNGFLMMIGLLGLIVGMETNIRNILTTE